MRICVYEDHRTADLGPLTLTRPAADLLCGLTSLGEKQARHFAAGEVGYLCRPELADLLRARDPRAAVNDPAWLRAGPTVLVNARWLAPADTTKLPAAPFVGLCDGEVAFAVLDARRLHAVTPATVADCLADWAQALPTGDAGGCLIRYPWELVEHNADQIARDFEATGTPSPGPLPAGFALVGPAERLFIHPSATVEPMVVADTTGGPVWVGPGAVVTAFTRLEGPCAVGAGTHLNGARIRAGTTLGPHCRIGGEVECSIVQGFSNKSHDGFLGHSYVGEWVNLAAGTATADLRFDYRPISVRVGDGIVSTGRTKVGSAIGDHARAGLGVLLDCGSTVGAFATVLPTGTLAPRAVPSFTRYGPAGFAPVEDVDAALAAADIMMRRRGRVLTPALRAVYRAVAGRPAEVARPAVGPALRKTA